MSDDRIIAAGEAALAAAESIWRTGVYDPAIADHSADADRCRHAIDQMIRSVDGLDWSWLRPYRGNGAFEWCGAFAAWCWRAAGLKLDIRKREFASTWRLDEFGQYGPDVGGMRDPRPPIERGRLWLRLDEHSEARDVADFAPRAGDILLVGPLLRGDGRSALSYGQHVTLVERFDPSTGIFHTYEGNGGGLNPAGLRWEGVVRGERPIGIARHSPTTYFARRLLRPGLDDLT